jgi:ABC-type polysaccharide/polyol phosphate export permease
VAYSVSVVPEHIRRFYLFNPVAPLIDALRAALLGRTVIHWQAVGGATVAAALILVAGTLFFLRQDRQYADVI